ncbi:MAG: cobalamin-dependent protein, partial [Nanoarchaeota archaeon]|nr:cobalamin-dependent protein [Nanoarchaeota archaeon]
MNKIVLISPYCSDYIGIQSMYWHILNKGYDVYLIYFQRYETKYPPSDKDYETLINTIQDINPSIIGMSMASYAVDVAFKISDMVKSKSNALIVLGGVHPMISPDECIKYADVVCI